MDGTTYIKKLGEPDAPHPFSQPLTKAVVLNAERTLPDQQIPKVNAAQAEILYPYIVPKA